MTLALPRPPAADEEADLAVAEDGAVAAVAVDAVAAEAQQCIITCLLLIFTVLPNQ